MSKNQKLSKMSKISSPANSNSSTADESNSSAKSWPDTEESIDICYYGVIAKIFELVRMNLENGYKEQEIDFLFQSYQQSGRRYQNSSVSKLIIK